MTVRMYANLKGWPLERVEVALRHTRIHAEDCEHRETTKGWISHIDRTITLVGDLDDAQRQRLLAIAERCPVHQTLTSEVDIATSLV
jgi:putative redox protein